MAVGSRGCFQPGEYRKSFRHRGAEAQRHGSLSDRPRAVSLCLCAFVSNASQLYATAKGNGPRPARTAYCHLPTACCYNSPLMAEETANVGAQAKVLSMEGQLR
jgi:hypothetical protein